MKYFLIALISLLSLNSFSAKIVITVNSTKIDTLTVYITIDDATSKKDILILLKKEGQFSFEYETKIPLSMNFYDGRNRVRGVLEGSDDVSIEYDYENLAATFSAKGKGAVKYFPDNRKEIQTRIAQAGHDPDEKNIDNCFRMINDLEKQLQDSINNTGFREGEARTVLSGFYKSLFNYSKRRLIGKVFPNVPLTILLKKTGTGTYLRNEIGKLLHFDPALYASPDYTNDTYYCLLQEYMTLTLEKYVPGDVEDKYRFYLEYLPAGDLRERVLCILLTGDFRMMNDTDFLTLMARTNYPETAPAIYKEYVNKLIDEYGTLFRKGTAAPDFSLTDTAGRVISLKDLRGKVVFMDFWYAKCIPCLSLIADLKELKEKYHNKDVIFLNISIDKKDEWLQAIKKIGVEGYNVYTQDKQREHPVIKDYIVNGYPSTCIIDRNGNFFNASPPYANMEALSKQINNALDIQQ